MEDNDDNLSNCKSLGALQMHHGSTLDLTKKRKLQRELLSLPVQKQMCLSRGSTPSSTQQGCSKIGYLQPNVIAKEKDGAASSQSESAEGSNSFMEESTSIISASSELQTTPTASDVIWGSNSSENITYSSDVNEVKDMEIRDKEYISSLYSDGPINLRRILEEQILEFETQPDYNGNHLMEHSADNETENVLYSNHETNANSYVLSSGRWNIERDGQATARKPTIDKEFEQYFSMLML
ncbi:hypothetical protein SAY87_012276 [Trapa incisa]|uniref:Uncharacterized protein n=1 Tax=Trapa incisa TaxID=236973 RepID=A0AAN7GXL9_9MYRT|nr:hypothetical protein SAY87_012276 [Trapa incisa]